MARFKKSIFCKVVFVNLQGKICELQDMPNYYDIDRCKIGGELYQLSLPISALFDHCANKVYKVYKINRIDKAASGAFILGVTFTGLKFYWNELEELEL